MKYAANTDLIFTRYDIVTEVAHRKARRVSEDELLQKVAEWPKMP